MSYDNICKYLAETYPADFVRWLLKTEPPQVEVLKTELSLEPIRADSVTFLRTANQILHLEFQTKPLSKPPIPFRILDYKVRLRRQYKCPIIQVVVFLQETSNEIAFTEEYRDSTTTHRYQVIRLWEQEPTWFLENLALLPFAPLTRSNSPQGLLAQVAQKVATIEDRQQRANLASCTGLLAGLRFDKSLIRQLLREEIMRESVIYQDILQKGQQQGQHQEILSVVTRLLNQRLGHLDSSLSQKIQTLSTEQLEALVEALFNITQIADLVAWLEQQELN